jgi:flagellar biosynthesis protein FlhA
LLSRGIGKVAVPAGVVLIVLMLVIPLPAFILDLLLVVNISASLLILLVSMYAKRPLDFAIFPALLLIATMFRLALNVSTTRLVLLDGYAGKVVEAFGSFVMGGSLVVGMVIFLILVVIQFMVITNGATRVAEVGARFTLDAMPGKQMAIDADLNSGLIDEDTARSGAPTSRPRRLLRRDGRRLEVRQGRRHRRHHHHDHQPARRLQIGVVQRGMAPARPPPRTAC